MNKPSVLVVHGALGSAAQMQPIADALSASGRFASVRVIELPGHGQTPLAEGAAFSMDYFADIIAVEASDAKSADDCAPVVFGYSMGGYAALLLASRAPGAFTALVTLGTMLRWSPEVATLAASRLDPAVIAAKVPAFADTLAKRHAHAGGWEPLMHRTAALLRGLGEAPPLTDAAFAAVPCPVHLLVGEKDDSVTLADCEVAAALMPHAQATMLPGVPHPIEKVPIPAVVSFVVSAVRA
jgi:pimeloyl-ACP methyl ester carboxylesterase